MNEKIERMEDIELNSHGVNGCIKQIFLVVKV